MPDEKAKTRVASVLIVEDEQIVALDLQQILRGLGYDAFAIAATAEEAIARASERRPDVVLMDIRIRGSRDGIECAKVFRDRFSIPVIFLTAHADSAMVERAKMVEPWGYLVKPVKITELRSAIELAVYRHELEARLRERERWFSTTLRSIGDAILAVDLAGRITFMNAAAEALTGIDAASALGEPIQLVLQLLDRPIVESPVLTALREERSVELQESGLRNRTTGARRLISDSATPVLLDDQLLGAVMVIRDVTEQKKLQKKLEIADRLASLGTMAAGVAHEINNPLAVVLANAGFLAEDLGQGRSFDPSDPKRVETLTATVRDLQSAANRIARIVSDLRAFSQPTVETSQTNVQQCVEWAIRATAEEFRDRARLDTEVGPVPLVNADEMRLGQVLVNLLTNAAHAISPGAADRNRVTVSVGADQAGRAAIEVRDTGSGIPKSIIERIFEPFFSTKPAGQGTGLGLSICHGIIAGMGGEIQVESELGKGTTFRVLLPAAKADSPSSTPSSPQASVACARILVIDDEEMILRVLARILREHDLRCTTNAREALSWIDAGQKFDLILSDLIMPATSGMDLFEELLAHHPDLARRVVFMTGGAITPKAGAFLRSVSNPRLEKPFEAQALSSVIQELLAQAGHPAH